MFFLEAIILVSLFQVAQPVAPVAGTSYGGGLDLNVFMTNPNLRLNENLQPNTLEQLTALLAQQLNEQARQRKSKELKQQRTDSAREADEEVEEISAASPSPSQKERVSSPQKAKEEESGDRSKVLKGETTFSRMSFNRGSITAPLAKEVGKKKESTQVDTIKEEAADDNSEASSSRRLRSDSLGGAESSKRRSPRKDVSVGFQPLPAPSTHKHTRFRGLNGDDDDGPLLNGPTSRESNNNNGDDDDDDSGARSPMENHIGDTESPPLLDTEAFIQQLSKGRNAITNDIQALHNALKGSGVSGSDSPSRNRSGSRALPPLPRLGSVDVVTTRQMSDPGLLQKLTSKQQQQTTDENRNMRLPQPHNPPNGLG